MGTGKATLWFKRRLFIYHHYPSVRSGKRFARKGLKKRGRRFVARSSAVDCRVNKPIKKRFSLLRGQASLSDGRGLARKGQSRSAETHHTNSNDPDLSLKLAVICYRIQIESDLTSSLRQSGAKG